MEKVGSSLLGTAVIMDPIVLCFADVCTSLHNWHLVTIKQIGQGKTIRVSPSQLISVVDEHIEVFSFAANISNENTDKMGTCSTTVLQLIGDNCNFGWGVIAITIFS